VYVCPVEGTFLDILGASWSGRRDILGASGRSVGSSVGRVVLLYAWH
jgi:hypothetical protein